MGRACIHCGASQKRGSLLSFHRFPKDEIRRQQWIAACGLENNAVAENSILCSKHFLVDDYDEHIWPRRTLKTTAVPSPSPRQQHVVSISVPAPIVVKEELHNPSLEGCSQEATSTSVWCEKSSLGAFPNSPCQEATLNECSPLKRTPIMKRSKIMSPYARYVGDLQEVHFSTPKKTRIHLNLVKDTVKRQKNKIKVLRIQNKRLHNTINSMKSLLQHLMEELLLSEEAANTVAIHL